MVFPISLMMVNWLGKALMIISAVPKSVATCFLLCICYYANDSMYLTTWFQNVYIVAWCNKHSLRAVIYCVLRYVLSFGMFSTIVYTIKIVK
jgi:hypothetical protein